MESVPWISSHRLENPNSFTNSFTHKGSVKHLCHHSVNLHLGEHEAQHKIEQKGQWKQKSCKILEQSLTVMEHAMYAECLQTNPEILGS